MEAWREAGSRWRDSLFRSRNLKKPRNGERPARPAPTSWGGGYNRWSAVGRLPPLQCYGPPDFGLF
eukprot:8886739-Karenia_brevis.AAC.1